MLPPGWATREQAAVSARAGHASACTRRLVLLIARTQHAGLGRHIAVTRPDSWRTNCPLPLPRRYLYVRMLCNPPLYGVPIDALDTDPLLQARSEGDATCLADCMPRMPVGRCAACLLLAGRCTVM